MPKKIVYVLSSLSLLVALLLSSYSVLLAAEPVVRAILFYSPTCSHCHYVITEVIPPLVEKYGEQCQIVGINTAEPDGQALYQAAIQAFAIPAERRGVPTLIIGETVLVGSGEIPEQLPGMVERLLEADGIDWPTIPGLAETLGASATESEPAGPDSPVLVTSEDVVDDTTWQQRFARDPLGNGISVVVLLAMIASIFYNTSTIDRTPSKATQQRWQWVIPPLVVLGLAVAGYLAYVETQQVAAVCGPVGDCNAVQQSDFARLFGVLPIGVLGVIGYLAIGGAWFVACYSRGRLADLAKLSMVGMTWFGLLFSIYLTFLEPFVIGATCAWCLTSAVVMTLLFWVTFPLTLPSLRTLRVVRDSA